MIISLLNEKGGVGKSTLTSNLATYMTKVHNKKVLLVDTDKQGTLRDWHSLSESDMDLVTLDTPKSIKSLKGLASNFDLVFVDGAGKAGLDGISIEAIKQSELILIPIQTGYFDHWGSESVAVAAKARQELYGGPDVRFVLNRVNKCTKLYSEVTTKGVIEFEDDTMGAYSFPCCTSTISQREDFKKVASKGLSVFDMQESKSFTEIAALAEEILCLN